MTTKSLNADGLYQSYGPRDAANDTARNVPSRGMVKQVIVDFDYSKLALLSTSKPTTFWGGTAADATAACIPADSRILGVSLFVNTAFAGNSSVLQVGLYNAAGTAKDADGLIKDLAVASMGANTDVTYDSSTASAASVSPLMGTVASASNALYIGMHQSAASKAFTAGTARLVVDYIRNIPA